MKVHVSLEHRFFSTPDGAVWTTSSFSKRFWVRYLDAFSHVNVVARVLGVPRPEAGWLRVDGPGVSVTPLPYFVGPAQFAAKAFAVRRTLDRVAAQDGAVILRLPSVIGYLLGTARQRRGSRYFVEVVGDPYEVFAPGAVRHPLRPLIRHGSKRMLVGTCRRAMGALYVTHAALQARYPCPRYQCGISDAELPDSAFISEQRLSEKCTAQFGKEPRLISVGTLEQLYKGQDILLRAMSECISWGARFRLQFVGGGRYQSSFVRLAQELHLADRVEFSGTLPSGPPVIQALDKCDIFVMPSRAEGLPRALLEAMARGLPCIASEVGGIPEILARSDLFEPGDVEAVARKISEVLAGGPENWREMGSRNLSVAREFSDARLNPLRKAFYELVRQESLK